MLRRIGKVLIFLQLILLIQSVQDKCHILSLEGGGDKGAYQAGVIWGLANSTKDVEWDVISGISVGSINGIAISLFPKGQEKEATDLLINLWKGLRGYGDIFTSWSPNGVIQGLFSESGLFTTEPLSRILANVMANRTIQRDFIIGATNVATGSYDVFDYANLNRSEYVDAILSSAAFPLFFPNIKLRNNSYMDGGVKYSVDIPSAIQRCRDKGFSDDKIVIDSILCSESHIENVDASNYKSIDVLSRTIKLFMYNLKMSDLIEIGHIFPNVTLRYVIGPSKTLPDGMIPLDFNPTQIEQMISIGISDAKTTVASKKGKTFEKLRKKYIMKKARIYLNKKDVTLEEAELMMNKIKEGKLRDYERMKKKFLGKY